MPPKTPKVHERAADENRTRVLLLGKQTLCPAELPLLGPAPGSEPGPTAPMAAVLITPHWKWDRKESNLRVTSYPFYALSERGDTVPFCLRCHVLTA